MENTGEISLESFVAGQKTRFDIAHEERLAREMNHVKELVVKAASEVPRIEVGYEVHNQTVDIFRESGLQLRRATDSASGIYDLLFISVDSASAHKYSNI